MKVREVQLFVMPITHWVSQKQIKADLSHTSNCTSKTIVEEIDYNEFGQMTSVLMGNRH